MIQTRDTQKSTQINLIRLLLLAAIVTYYLPWLISGSAALSPSAPDLAEWISLHPAAGALNTSLLLRLPFVCIALLIAFTAPKNRSWWLHMGLVGCIWIALLPPLEFFTDAGARDNVNFQQQFALLVVAVIGSSVGLSRLLGRWQRLCILGITLIIIATSVIGIAQAHSLMSAFGYTVEIGFGSPGLVAAAILLVMLTLLSMLQNKQGSRSTRTALSSGA